MYQKTNKLNSLQALRGIAALLVVMYHAYVFSNSILNYNFLSGFFKFGYAGVDLFFVLSGFIIFYIHQKDFGNITKLKLYIVKRFVRVFPIYWVINLFIIPLYFFFPKFGGGYETQFNSIVSSLILLPQDHFPIISVAWTLTHELRFYFIFGLIILFGFRKSLPIIIFLMIGTLINSYQHLIGTNYVESPLLNSIFSHYNLEFILGCIVAYIVTRHSLIYKQLLLILGIIIYIGAAFLYESWGIGQGSVYRIIAYGIPSAIIILALASYDLYRPKKIPDFMRFLGDASYSIYLTHYILISIIIRFFVYLNLEKFLNLFLTIILATVLTIFIGCLIHIFLEKPLLSYSRKVLLKVLKITEVLKHQ